MNSPEPQRDSKIRTARGRRVTSAGGGELPPGAIVRLGGQALRVAGEVTAMAAAPGGPWLAAASSRLDIHVWHSDTGRLAWKLTGPREPITALAFTHDGGTLLAASLDHLVRAWDLVTGAERFRIERHQGGVQTLRLSRDGRQLATASSDGWVRVWSLASGRELLACQDEERAIFSLAWRPDGQLLASGSDDGLVCYWDVSSTAPLGGRLLKRFRLASGRVDALDFTANGAHLIAGLSQKQRARVLVRHASSGQRVGELVAGAGRCTLALSDDSRTLVAGGDHVRVWQFPEGELQHKLDAGTPVQAVALVDERHVACGQADGAIRFFDLATGQEAGVGAGHSGVVLAAGFRPTGDDEPSWLATAGADRTVRFWNAANGEHRRELPTMLRLELPATALAWSPDGAWLATAGPDQIVRLWDWERGRDVRRLTFRSEVLALTFTPGGELVVSEGKHGGAVHVYDPASGRRLRSLPGDRGALAALALSPDGGELAAARAPAGQPERKCVLAVRNFETGEWVGRCGGPLSVPTCAAFSPDGRQLAAASQDETLRVWEVESLKEVRRIKLKSVAGGLAFAGGLLLAGDAAGRLYRWNLESGVTLPVIAAHGGEITALVASSDDRYLATVALDETTLIWNLATLASE